MKGFESLDINVPNAQSPLIRQFLDTAGIELVTSKGAQLGHLRGVRLRGSLIVHGRTGDVAVAWHRLRGSARNRCVFVFVVDGTLEIHSAGQHSTSPGGGVAMVAPGSEMVRFQLSKNAEFLFFSFDVSEIEPVAVDAEELRILPGHSVVFRAAYSYLLAGATSPVPEDSASLDVFRALTHDVARGLVLESNAPGSFSDLVDRARVVMAYRFASPSFSTEKLAVELHVSRRSLERAFARRGMRVSDELRKVRAQRALRLLESNSPLTIDAIASACGFRSEENLRRATKKYFGASPTVLRRAEVRRE